MLRYRARLAWLLGVSLALGILLATTREPGTSLVELNRPPLASLSLTERTSGQSQGTHGILAGLSAASQAKNSVAPDSVGGPPFQMLVHSPDIPQRLSALAFVAASGRPKEEKAKIAWETLRVPEAASLESDRPMLAPLRSLAMTIYVSNSENRRSAIEQLRRLASEQSEAFRQQVAKFSARVD